MPEDLTFYTIIGSMVAALTSAKAWDFWNKRAIEKRQASTEENKEKNMYRDDLKAEVGRLRTELVELYKKREEEMQKLNDTITELSEALAGMRVRVEFLESENIELKRQLSEGA